MLWLAIDAQLNLGFLDILLDVISASLVLVLNLLAGSFLLLCLLN